MQEIYSTHKVEQTNDRALIERQSYKFNWHRHAALFKPYACFIGFLNANDGKTTGNYALFDLVAALQWLKENISPFGGDPNEVTLLGHGYGGALVNLLLVSPLTKGMILRSIMIQISLIEWAFDRWSREKWFSENSLRQLGYSGVYCWAGNSSASMFLPIMLLANSVVHLQLRVYTWKLYFVFNNRHFFALIR